MTATDWMTHPDRPCATQDPEAYFPNTTRISAATARVLCAGCPVASACLDYAIRNRLHGVWGGTSDEERARVGAL